MAVDTSVLFAVFKGEASGAAWLDFLLRLRRENQLVACDVVWAEISPLFDNLQKLGSSMAGLGVMFSPLDEEVSFTAGQLFAKYPSTGGSRNRMIPDFMIAAHAFRRSTGLATADAGYMRTYFPRLKIFQP